MSVANSWTVQNCGSQDPFTELEPKVYQVSAQLSNWYLDLFCQVINEGVVLHTPSDNYEATVDLYSNMSMSHPGIAFNWMDGNNYDYFFIR